MQVLGTTEALRLSQRFQFLTRSSHAGSHAVGARQHTLRATLEWSWNLLTAHERCALAQCAVFRGGFRLDAAETIVELTVAPPEIPPPVIDIIQTLAEKSLLTGSSSATLDPCWSGTNQARAMDVFN